jgi:hypothetical protein
MRRLKAPVGLWGHGVVAQAADAALTTGPHMRAWSRQAWLRGGSGGGGGRATAQPLRHHSSTASPVRAAAELRIRGLATCVRPSLRRGATAACAAARHANGPAPRSGHRIPRPHISALRCRPPGAEARRLRTVCHREQQRSGGGAERLRTAQLSASSGQAPGQTDRSGPYIFVSASLAVRQPVTRTRGLRHPPFLLHHARQCRLGPGGTKRVCAHGLVAFCTACRWLQGRGCAAQIGGGGPQPGQHRFSQRERGD